ncbi:MAG TPA: DUF4349 domain-containing protein [Gemmatimonadaceae bacterium]|nr:DUF4349 domain-containing protein [Gemmatimonadaceae bacterium]
MTAHDMEAVMAYLDGELPPEAAGRVKVHLDECEECRTMASDMRAVSDQLGTWHVESAPATLRSRPRRWRIPPVGTLLAAAAGVVLTVALASMLFRSEGPDTRQTSATATPMLVAPAIRADDAGLLPVAPPAGVAAGRETGQAATDSLTARQRIEILQVGGPLIVRSITLNITVQDFDASRLALDRIARDAGGYIGDLASQGLRGGVPALRATLRVPAARLEDTVAALKQLGTVSSETQSNDDVTRQSTDLDARLSNARTSEARLKEVLQQRTGRLSDVLDVEREIARVRGEIEQMEAHRKSLDQQISYASVLVELSAERKAEIGLGPAGVSTRLRNAVVDGWRRAFEGAIGIVLFVAGAGPTLLLWGLVLSAPALLLRRRWRGHHPSS